MREVSTWLKQFSRYFIFPTALAAKIGITAADFLRETAYPL